MTAENNFNVDPVNRVIGTTSSSDQKNKKKQNKNSRQQGYEQQDSHIENDIGENEQDGGEFHVIDYRA